MTSCLVCIQVNKNIGVVKHCCRALYCFQKEPQCEEENMVWYHAGVRFTKYFTIYLEFIVRSTYDSDLQRAKISLRNMRIS